MRDRRKRRCCDRESECCCYFGEAERPGRGTWRSIRWICGISARWTWCSRRTARIRVEKSEACEVDSLMQQSVYSMIETLVPRGEDGGLKNRNEYLQVFGKGSNGRPHWVVILEEPCFVCCNKHSNTDGKVLVPSPAPWRWARDEKERIR